MVKTFKKLSVTEKTTDFRKAVRVVEIPLVPPKDNQVLIKNIYVGVNACDILVTGSNYSIFTDGKLPHDVGCEALGQIQAVGSNVDSLKVGQPVVYSSLVPRTYAEYMYAEPEELIPVPEIKPEFLVAMFCGLTATIGLDEAGRIKPGDKVLITAAAGGTGHIGVQWAKQRNCYVIGLTSSPEKADLLFELGTDRLINYKTENLDEVLAKEFPSGIDVIWETIGGQVMETLFKHLAPKGRFVIVGEISGYKTGDLPDISINKLPTQLLMGNKTLVGFNISAYEELIQKYLKQLIEDISNKKLKCVLDLGQNSTEGPFVGIDSIVRGVEHLHSGANTGKVVIKLNED